MALEPTMKDLQSQNAQFQELVLNIFKGQEELKALLTKDMKKKNPEDNKDDQLEQLQAEMAEMRIQMNGQMALIQNLAQGQEKLRVLVNKLQDNRVGDPIISQPPVKQADLVERKMRIREGKRQVTTDSLSIKGRRPYRVVAPPIQQRDNPLQQKEPKRQFTKINTLMSQTLQYLLEMNLVALREPPQKPNTSSPHYDPNVRCEYHSNSPGHDTNSCWALKNKIQDLINERVLEFTQDGQIEFFYHPSNIGAARHIV